MNCFLETVASMWLMSRRSLGLRTPVYEDETIQESLEGCRMSLEGKESELVEACRRLAREALRRRQQGDPVGAKTKLMERRRGLKRLEKLRNNLTLVAGQIDELQNTELDRELMQTLLASSAALKRAGVGRGVQEAEDVMSQLEEQMRESSELTSVLSGPLQDDVDFDLDEELELLGKEGELAGERQGERVRVPVPGGGGAAGAESGSILSAGGPVRAVASSAMATPTGAGTTQLESLGGQ